MASPSAPSAITGASSNVRLGSVLAYVTAVVVTAFAILSQYFVPQSIPLVQPVYTNFWANLGVVYGIPIVAFLLLVGVRPLQSYRANLPTAALQGLRWYGLMMLLALVVMLVLLAIYFYVDPGALKLLNRGSPVLAEARSNPWFFIVFSFVIGALEETIFRGWIFGYWLARGTRSWFVHAVWTSAFFAGVHLYYGTTYGAISPVIFPSLFLAGFGFAAAMRSSRGNLVIIGLLHGANDAIAFFSLVSAAGATALHYGLILTGAIVALVLYLRQRPPTPASPYLPYTAPTHPPEYVVWNPPGSAPPPPPTTEARRWGVPSSHEPIAPETSSPNWDACRTST